MKHAPLVLLLAATGCADRLPLVGAPCPCAEGTVCDDETKQCVPSPSDRMDAFTVPIDALSPQPDDANAGPGDDGPPPGDDIYGTACRELGIDTVSDFETRFIAPRCGQAKCHGPMSVFPPRNLHMPAMIRTSLVGQKAFLACKSDYYIDREFPFRSFVLAKIWASGDVLRCPSEPYGKLDSGGTRMPNKDGMPTIVGTRLSLPELQCFTWWVMEVAKL